MPSRLSAVGLGVFSIVAWSIMLGKHYELKRLRELNLRFERQLRNERSLLKLPESSRDRRAIPYADLFADAVESYWRAAATGKGGQGTAPMQIAAGRLGRAWPGAFSRPRARGR